MISLIDSKEIYKVLPHRYPMLFVDGIIKIEYEKYVEGYKNVSMNEPWIQGHFPDEPIFPGVLIIETMAQIGGFIFYEKNRKDGSLKAYLSSADKVKFLKTVVPGDQIIVKAKFIQKFGRIVKVDCKAYVEDSIVAKAIIVYFFQQDFKIQGE